MSPFAITVLYFCGSKFYAVVAVANCLFSNSK